MAIFAPNAPEHSRETQNTSIEDNKNITRTKCNSISRSMADTGVYTVSRYVCALPKTSINFG